MDSYPFRGMVELIDEEDHRVMFVPIAFDLFIAEDANPGFADQAGEVLSKVISERYRALAEGRYEDVQYDN